jgi:hypothetical protein
MGLLHRVNNISKVQAGAPCIVKFDLGNTLDKIKIKLLGGLTPAMITKVQLRTDGRMVYESTGLRMLMQFAYKNISTAANEIVLNFTELDSRNGATEQLMACIPTNFLRDLSLELEIASTAPGTADIKVQSLTRAPTANPYIIKQFKHAFDVNNIGDNSLFIPAGALGAIIKRIFIHEAATNQITDIELTVNKVRMMETTRADYEAEQVYNRLVPQNKLLVLDFVQDGNVNGALSTLTPKGGQPLNVELRLTAQSLGLVDCYFEIVDHIGRL